MYAIDVDISELILNFNMRMFILLKTEYLFIPVTYILTMNFISLIIECYSIPDIEFSTLLKLLVG